MPRLPKSWIGFLTRVAGIASVVAAASPIYSVAERASDARLQLAQASFDWLRKNEVPPDKPVRRLGAIANWGYWLSSFDVEQVVSAPHDLMVVDNGVSANRRFMRERSAKEVARMRRRPDGTTRLLLAYLSFGEAERYRAYWRPEWHDPAKRPPWLGAPNPHWDGNYAVQYWQPEWQQLIFGAPESYLDIIMAQGFDGVYLDRADAFLQWEKSRPSARADMASFVRALSDYARRKNPNFLIVMQNAEELLDDRQVLEAIDGMAKEDLLYGVDRPEAPNKPQDVKYSVQQLRMAHNAGRKILVVEYLADPAKMETAEKLITAEGFVPYFARRSLNCLNPPAVPGATGALPPHPCR